MDAIKERTNDLAADTSSSKDDNTSMSTSISSSLSKKPRLQPNNVISPTPSTATTSILSVAPICIMTDSKYSIGVISERKQKLEANKELIHDIRHQIDTLIKDGHRVDLEWVKGHAGTVIIHHPRTYL
jgi:hypothetical protein